MAVAQLVATTLLSSFLRVHSLPVTSFDEAARYTTLRYGDGTHIAQENIPAAAAAWQTAIQTAIFQRGETIMIQTMFWPVEIQVHTCAHTSGRARVCTHAGATLALAFALSHTYAVQAIDSKKSTMTLSLRTAMAWNASSLGCSPWDDPGAQNASTCRGTQACVCMHACHANIRRHTGIHTRMRTCRFQRIKLQDMCSYKSMLDGRL